MADSATTTNSVQISSAGRVAPHSRQAATLPAVQLAHIALVGAVVGLKPHRIVGHYADRFDILERADHLAVVLAAVTIYTKAIVADTADFAPIGYVKDETGLLMDAASDIVGALNNAVDKMLDDAVQAAE